jgi:hypothetical protein
MEPQTKATPIGSNFWGGSALAAVDRPADGRARVPRLEFDRLKRSSYQEAESITLQAATFPGAVPETEDAHRLRVLIYSIDNKVGAADREARAWLFAQVAAPVRKQP